MSILGRHLHILPEIPKIGPHFKLGGLKTPPIRRSFFLGPVPRISGFYSHLFHYFYFFHSIFFYIKYYLYILFYKKNIIYKNCLFVLKTGSTLFFQLK